MRTLILLAFFASACSGVPCGSGTIERNGACVSADVTTGTAECGPDTMLVGNMCVSTTVCDPDTTMPMTGSDGVTTCVGTAGGGCGTCPSASGPNQQTICGQIYDFETNQAFVASGATGMKCPTTPASSGPCALGIKAFDAIAFAMNPATATPLAVGDTCIDDMGRYYLKDITEPSGPFVGLGLDDADSANLGPAGLTNLVGVATKKNPGGQTTGFEHWIVKPSTTAAWTASGGPTISTGFYVPVYRTHCIDVAGSGPGCMGDPLVNQAGVMFTGGTASSKFYFQAAQATRHDVDVAATVTGVNGTALVANATLSDSFAYTGVGGITDTVNCKWDTLSGQTLSGVVFIQVWRKINALGKTCTE